MDPNVGKRQYLITYSRADLEQFPTRESFGQSLEVAFNAGSGKVNVSHWACSQCRTSGIQKKLFHGKTFCFY